jgi:hypothetical protein
VQTAADFDFGAADYFAATQAKSPLMRAVPRAITVEALEQFKFLVGINCDLVSVHGTLVSKTWPHRQSESKPIRGSGII